MNKTMNKTKMRKNTLFIMSAKAAGGVGRAIPAYIAKVRLMRALDQGLARTPFKVSPIKLRIASMIMYIISKQKKFLCGKILINLAEFFHEIVFERFLGFHSVKS